MAQLGRISGPLLQDNLERQGVDLKFRDDLNSTPLLYLDVNTKQVAVNYNGTPLADLYVNSPIETVNLAVTSGSATIGNFTLGGNTIQLSSGNITLDALQNINLSGLGTDNLLLDDAFIGTRTTDTNVILDPSGTGTVEFYADTTVDGNIHATQNITADGNLILGSGSEDNITLNAELTNNLLPDQTDQFAIGSAGKKFSKLYSPLLNGEVVNAGSLAVSSLSDLGAPTGNVYYVAQNGDDTNRGDHPQGPFKTIKRALDFADGSSGGPVTIYVLPGGYEEVTPLVVPANTTICGLDMRNTIIRPESAYQSNDIFHVTGEVTIQNLTLKDFYYDSGNDRGYGFRFAPNAVINTRSPYIQNCTVITQGTTTSASDPRGFDSGDAGKGALVDGLSVTTTSEEASMLFHSVTLITPGVDALTMTNGVRVEWLNCFTYFANRGIYVTNGTGRTDNRDGSTVVYGGELRSIASASVYGNKGIEGDGDSVLCYLINHNLAYIGVGKRVDNDESRAIQANEVIKSNSAKIFFQTQDHTGDFRVGDSFAIDFETGSTTLNLAAASFANYNSLVIEDASGITQIYADRLEVGDFILSGNTIQTRNLDLTLDSYATNNKIKFLANTNLEQKLTLQDGITISGNFTYTGEQIDNQLVLGANIGSDLNPSTTGTFNIGNSTDRWRRISASEINVSDIKLETNVITTTVSNSDLEFRASGTGKILLANNNLEVTNQLTANSITNLNNLNVTGDLTFSGAVDFTQPFTTEDINVERLIVSGNDAQFEDVKIQTNFLTTTQSNSNLELRASGSGIIDINKLNISNNATVSGTFTVSDSNNFTTVNSEFDTGDIKIYQNVIETTNSNSDLELRSYTGRIKVADVFFDNPTTISTASSNLTLGGAIIDMSSANKYLLLSKGTTAQRDSNLGSLRYNTDNNAIEGFSTAYLHTRGIFSQDRSASITAHNTNDTLIFQTNDTTQGTLDGTKLTMHNLTANQISIDGNSIIAENSNSDLEIIATGNANVFFEDFEIQGNNIIQVNTNSGTTIGASGANGLTQFGGTNGVQIPVGTTAERPGSAGTGQLRWNTTTNELEAYTGSAWGIAAGVPQNVSLQFVDDTNFENTLIFG